jgi:hypothetical protein
VVYWLLMTAQKTTLGEIGQMIERGFKAVADDIANIRREMATKDDIGRLDTRVDDLGVEMINQFRARRQTIRDNSLPAARRVCRTCSDPSSYRTIGVTGREPRRIFKRD